MPDHAAAGKTRPEPAEAVSTQFNSHDRSLAIVFSTPPTIPDHELLRRIGNGSYGDVWLAKNAVGTLQAGKIENNTKMLANNRELAASK